MCHARTVAGVRALASIFDELAALDEADDAVRLAVEFSRASVGLDRVAIFLLDEPAGLLTGTWGTDMYGRTVDEHHVTWAIRDDSRSVFRRAAVEGKPWTVVEDCPLVVQLERETRVVGRGWVACTPIASERGPVGMMFNDAGLSGNPVDETKQTLAAILCARLGTLLDGGSPDRLPWVRAKAPAAGSIALELVRSLRADPSVSGAALAERHGLSVSRMARIFKSELGVTIVAYRNRLRMERFFSLMRSRGGAGMLDAALEAGFGSYAQFHRTFRSLYGDSPREYLRSRPRWRRARLEK